MSVEGVPSVDDVLKAIGRERKGRWDDDVYAAEAVHALYAPVSADAARHREALDELELHDRTGDPYDEGYSAALADIRAALVEPKGQD